jgi:ATP-dependent DNA helicase DinG
VSSTSQPATLAARLPSLYQFFGPGGLLARTHPAYEFRRGQLQMAEAVEQALQERRHLIVEAGTGTGKTLAYLLPVIRSGKRVIISTGTKTLQEQLFYKDVPFLREHLGELRVCYMKGRGNYLCRKKLYDLTSQPVLNGLEEINQFSRSCRKTATYGPSLTPAPTAASAATASSSTAASSPRCGGAPSRATSSL